MPRLVLLGDSILDNASYAYPGPDTATVLRALLGDAWQVDLIARDGATMPELPSQLTELDGRPDVAILSIGGNDVTRHLDLLEPAATTTTALLGTLGAIADGFGARYDAALADTQQRVERLVACTIYEVALSGPPRAELARVPLSLLNDRIVRAAARAGTEVLDLRTVCTDPDDFVLEIEPSARGAAKIAAAIAAIVQHGQPGPAARVYAVRQGAALTAPLSRVSARDRTSAGADRLPDHEAPQGASCALASRESRAASAGETGDGAA